jgi:hypothetical protein
MAQNGCVLLHTLLAQSFCYLTGCIAGAVPPIGDCSSSTWDALLHVHRSQSSNVYQTDAIIAPSVQTQQSTCTHTADVKCHQYHELIMPAWHGVPVQKQRSQQATLKKCPPLEQNASAAQDSCTQPKRHGDGMG